MVSISQLILLVLLLNLNYMMNSSNGFGGNSLLGNSTGFKRRPLRPPSGILNKKPEFLRSIDISLAEPVIATSFRSQIAAIEQEINLLDKDKKLRQGQGGLQKGYISALRKWLRDGHSLIEKQDDQVKILKQMGAQSYEKGFQKLWKIVCNLDLTITKITELQIINFLIYDEMFDEIGKDTQRSSGLLSQISNNGYTPGTFQITQIILDRLKDVYAGCKKGSQPIKTAREEVKTNQDKKIRQETNELISQLRSQNQKLNTMLQQIIKEKQQEKIRANEREKQLATQTKKQTVSVTQNIGSAKNTFKEIEEKYEQQLKTLSAQRNQSQNLVAQLRAKISSLESHLKAANQSNTSRQLPPAKSGSYEQALMEEMQKMKKGFQKKIATLTQDFTNRQKELRKKEIEYKTQNQKIKWEKSLLLKKFEVISK